MAEPDVKYEFGYKLGWRIMRVIAPIVLLGLTWVCSTGIFWVYSWNIPYDNFWLQGLRPVLFGVLGVIGVCCMFMAWYAVFENFDDKPTEDKVSE